LRTNYQQKTPLAQPKRNWKNQSILLISCALLSWSCERFKPASGKKENSSINSASTMQATIISKKLFPDIPSASGMELIGDKLYVIGDDSPYLYILNRASLQLEDKIELFKTNLFVTGRIPKAFKPDLEALTKVEINNITYLAAFGSGSAPTRTPCYLISLPITNATPVKVQEYSLKELYGVMQQEREQSGDNLLNLEAASTHEDQLFLFQRSVQKEANILYRYNLSAFLQHLHEPATPLPPYEKIPFRLPQLAGLDARFSGAVSFKDKLFVTASVENTNDAILDGEVLGSFVGWVPLADITASDQPIMLRTGLILEPDGQTYQGKVESLVITGRTDANTYQALAFTDNDNGESELLTLEIKL